MKRYLQRVVFCTEGEWPEGTGPEDKVPGRLQPEEKIREKFQKHTPEEGTLYITDSEICLCVLKEKGLPVAAWLHEGNRKQDLSAAMYAVESPEVLDMDFYEKIYRREKGIPWEILKTDRCLVREMVPEDAESFYDMYQEPAICKYMTDFHGDVAGEEAYIREYQQKYRFFGHGVWSIVLKETGQVIGRAGFSETEDFAGIQIVSGKERIVSEDGEMEEASLPCLGYMIGVPWQGQGLALEVCKAILDYAKAELGFHKVQLFVEQSNEASMGLSKKLGFTDAGWAVEGKGSKVVRRVLAL